MGSGPMRPRRSMARPSQVHAVGRHAAPSTKGMGAFRSRGACLLGRSGSFRPDAAGSVMHIPVSQGQTRGPNRSETEDGSHAPCCTPGMAELYAACRMQHGMHSMSSRPAVDRSERARSEVSGMGYSRLIGASALLCGPLGTSVSATQPSTPLCHRLGAPALLPLRPHTPGLLTSPRACAAPRLHHRPVRDTP